MRIWHRLVHGHWPIWRAGDYDFLSWRWYCLWCHTATITRFDG